MRFTGKVVIITGSGAGIGQAAAVAFAREGAKVVVNSVTEKVVQKPWLSLKNREEKAFMCRETFQSQKM